MKNTVLFLGILLIFSCKNEKIDENGKNEITINQEYKSSTSFVFSGNSVYSKFFDNNTDTEIAYYSTKANVNDRDIVRIGSSIQTKSNEVSIYANGIELNSLNNQIQTKSGSNIYDNLFGKEVTFILGSPQTKSTTTNDGISMYVPYIIDIIYPEASKTELQPLCPHDDLLIEWNKDENNSNGVVIIVEWDGNMVGQDSKNEGIRTIDIVEDTGRAILKTAMFEGIPDLAMINITILRGNIDIVELENIPVKLYAASNSSITVVLAKEPI